MATRKTKNKNKSRPTDEPEKTRLRILQMIFIGLSAILVLSMILSLFAIR